MQLEALLKAEEEPGVICEFINSLGDADRAAALKGMLEMLEYEDPDEEGGYLTDEEVYRRLKALAQGS